MRVCVHTMRLHCAIKYSALRANQAAALREVDEPTYPAWRLYMAACALEFESGGTGINRILASRRDRGKWPIPMIWGDLYASRL